MTNKRLIFGLIKSQFPLFKKLFGHYVIYFLHVINMKIIDSFELSSNRLINWKSFHHKTKMLHENVKRIIISFALSISMYKH